MQSTGEIKHLPRLDSLRGVAALMVAGYHALSADESFLVEQTFANVLGFFFDGRTGVSIFFVLSGLVLGMSLRRSGALTAKGYARFCVRRFFRLYPAYFFSTLFYLALYLLVTTRLHHGESIGKGFSDYDMVPTETKVQMVENFLFLHQGLNHVTWTLKVEVIAAFLLPLAHLYSRQFQWKGQTVLLLTLMALAFLPSSAPTRMCLYLFYIGYLIPMVLEKLRSIQFPKPDVMGALLFFATTFAFATSHAFPATEEGRRLGIFFACIGSSLLLGLMLSDFPHNCFRLLDHPAFRYLGAISYSFYLLNLFCLDIVLRGFSLFPATAFLAYNHTLLSSGIVFVCTTILCVGLATLSYYWIERPAIKLGAYFYRP